MLGLQPSQAAVGCDEEKSGGVIKVVAPVVI